MSSDAIDFDRDVLAASHRHPVLVDFWAPWCGPCKMLKPVLERLATEAGGRWMLVKVNTEEQPEIAARFSIRGIPDVRLFHHGAEIAQFSGALPEPQIRRWLEEQLPTPKRDLMARARSLLLAGHAAEAAALLEPLVAGAPGDAELAGLTARALVFVRPAAAARLADTVPAGSAWADSAAMVRAIAAALTTADQQAPNLTPGALRDRYLAGLAALRRQDFATAARELVDVLLEKPNYDEGRARAACRALFQHLGPRHPVTEENFRSYSMAVNC